MVKESRSFFQIQDFGPLTFLREDKDQKVTLGPTRLVRMQKAAKNARRPIIFRINVQNGGKSLNAIYSNALEKNAVKKFGKSRAKKITKEYSRRRLETRR